MSKNFWDKLEKSFFCLAPMADVTDAAFRRIIAKYSKCSTPGVEQKLVMWTEFVSADGLCHPKGREKLLPLLQFSKSERPIVAQIFGARPDKIREAAVIIAELGFDGLDINMGCPDRSVEKQGAGAALMKNPKLAREIIRAAKEGVAGRPARLNSRSGGIPVSVKTRLGFNKDELDKWLPELLAEEPAAITVHARTRKEMSKAAAHWDRVKRAVEIRDEFTRHSGGLKSKTLIIGNGDVVDMADAKQKAGESGADGVMFGRAIFGNPWLFNERRKSLTVVEKLRVLTEHVTLFEKLCQHKSFNVMKKHFKAYVTGFSGASELRTKLMEAENAKAVEKIIKSYLKSHPLTDLDRLC